MSPTTCTLFLAIVALTTAAGCASGTYPVDSAGPASPPTGQTQILDCRNRGVYNRAADLCVSEGP